MLCAGSHSGSLRRGHVPTPCEGISKRNVGSRDEAIYLAGERLDFDSSSTARDVGFGIGVAEAAASGGRLQH